MNYGLDNFLHDLVENKVDLTDQIYNYLSNTDIDRLQKWLNRLEKVRAFKISGNSANAKRLKGKKSNLVGRVFEKLIRVLLDDCNVLHHDGNIRSTISEIDFRIMIDPQGGCIPMLRENGTHAIGEAKCVQHGLKAEWLTELSGILSTHNATLGIIFTASPPKKLNVNHRHTLSLLAANNHKIIPIGQTQILKVIGGENFLKLLCDQYVQVMTHSSELCI